MTFVVWAPSHSRFRNTVPRRDVPRAVLVNGMIFAGSIRGLDVGELVFALLDSVLIFIFGLFGAIGYACHARTGCKPCAYRRSATHNGRRRDGSRPGAS